MYPNSPFDFCDVLIQPKEFRMIREGLFSDDCYRIICEGLSKSKWGENLYYETPHYEDILFADGNIYLCKEFLTVQHLPNEKKWKLTSWRKFSS